MASTPTNGDDVIFGTDADNTINSLGGNDLVFGGLGDDILQGSTGNDQLSGGLGVDILVGGSGSDTAFYGLALDDVRANLNLGFGFLTNLGQAADGDQFFSIENLTGGFGNDVLIGNSAANVINGNSGNDQINGGAGRDTINAGLGNDFVAGNEDGDVISGNGGDDQIRGGSGGDVMTGGTGNDTLDYAGSGPGVTIDLTFNTASGGDANFDVISGFENIIGTMAGDTLSGASGANLLQSQDGDDTLSGRDGEDYLAGQDGDDAISGGSGNDALIGGAGADALDGGTGIDTVYYTGATAGVIASFANPAGNTGDAAGDTYVSIENLTGSSFNDSFNGNNSVNMIIGGAGNDSIRGNLGNDVLFGQSGNDTLIGGTGADVLDGGTGDDVASYATAAAGVIASLLFPATNTGDAAGDTYVSIEFLAGSAHNDQLYGNNLVNRLAGGAGNDVLRGFLGNDLLWGQAGADIFLFNTALNAATNVDRIIDFAVVDDTIYLENAIFTALGAGALAAAAFAANATGLAGDASDRIIYETDTGKLFYDANGSGAGIAGVHFATLTAGLALTAADFFVF